MNLKARGEVNVIIEKLKVDEYNFTAPFLGGKLYLPTLSFSIIAFTFRYTHLISFTLKFSVGILPKKILISPGIIYIIYLHFKL